MPLTIRRVKRPVRGRGERANLTPDLIVKAAMEVLEDQGLDKFSGRDIAKKLGVSNAAIYAHIEGGLPGLKKKIAYDVLKGIARSYRPKESPASYFRDIVLRLLTATRGKQALAHLIGIELASDFLVCPQFAERLLSLVEDDGQKRSTADRFDLAVAALVGMMMLEAATNRDEITNDQATSLAKRLKALPEGETTTLLSHRVELLLQIKRRLLPQERHLSGLADRYAAPLIAALSLNKRPWTS
jgi:AcrR family transcriptional regulator